MKSAKILFDTIYGKCSNSDMYSWKACKPKEHDNVVSFDVRQKADNQLLCSCVINYMTVTISLAMYFSRSMMAVIH